MTINNETIYLGIAIGSVVWGIFSYFKKPQEKSAITDARFDEKFQALSREFANLRDNHLHTIEQKIDTHIKNQNDRNEGFSVSLTKIETMLNERLPNNK